MINILIIPGIIFGLIIWDYYWFCKILDKPPPDVPYSITLSAIPDPF
jgi:hypothetical protein